MSRRLQALFCLGTCLTLFCGILSAAPRAGGGGFHGSMGGFHGGGTRGGMTGVHGAIPARPMPGRAGGFGAPNFREPRIPRPMAPNPLLPPNRPFRFSKPAFPGRLRGFRTFVGGVFVGAPVFTWGVPYFAPFWSPYDYWDSYGYGTAPALPDYAPPPQYGPSYTPPPSTAPPSSSTPPEQPKQLSMLAFKDHTVAEVEDYWLQGDQVYYLTPEGVQHFVSIDQLDLPATERLNRQRNLPFVLESRP